MTVSAEVATLFLEELARRNLPVKVNEDGNYVVEINGTTITSCLDNISREFERKRDPQRIIDFVESITSTPQLPDWEEARLRICWQAESADNEFGDTFRDQVSDQIALALAYVDPSETQIMWLSPALAARWGKSREELWAAAVPNMEQIVRATTVEIVPIDEHRLGVLQPPLTAFKAALLFSPHLREVVEPVLGWPLFAVAPCRDFVYLLNQQDRDLLGRMGHVVVKEYAQGAYPLSVEVFEITDQGIRAFAEFQKPPGATDEDEEEETTEDGMKTIRYRGGTVVFRIPEHWEEEYADEGGGTFYDEDSPGTLRLSTLLFESKEPITTHHAHEVLEGSDEPDRSEVIDLGRGNCMITYTKQAEEDGEPVTIYCWQLANPVPPQHLRVAIFRFWVPTTDIDDEEIVEQRALIDREVRRCEFASEVGE